MRKEKLAIVRGSGNAFRDLGHQSADVDQCKAILAAEIIKVLDREGLSVRGAHGLIADGREDKDSMQRIAPRWRTGLGERSRIEL